MVSKLNSFPNTFISTNIVGGIGAFSHKLKGDRGNPEVGKVVSKEIRVVTESKAICSCLEGCCACSDNTCTSRIGVQGN